MAERPALRYRESRQGREQRAFVRTGKNVGNLPLKESKSNFSSWSGITCTCVSIAVACVVVVASTLGVLRGQEAKVSNQSWLVGFAKEDITPTEPMWLSGFASRSRAPSLKEVSAASNRLFLRAVALRPYKEPNAFLILIAIDLIGADKAFTDHVYDRLRKELGYSRSAVRLCFSHTHSGPFVGENLFPLAPEDDRHRNAVKSYASALEQKIVEAVRDAADSTKLNRVHARFGEGSIGLSVNRRQVKESQFDGVRRGDTEDGVPVLWFESLRTGAPVGGVFGYAAHATTVTSGYQYHGDFPGVASAVLEERFGGSWLFICGAAGDQNIYPRGAITDAEKHGSSLAAEVGRIVSRNSASRAIDDILGTGVTVFHEFISLPFRTRLSALELRRMARSRRDDSVSSVRTATRWLEVLSTRNDGASLSTPSTYDEYPISLWRIGSLTIVFLGGEPTVGFVAAIRDSTDVSWIVGYSDDVMGYVGTKEVLMEGLREGSDRAAVYYGLPCAWDPSVEMEIVTCISRMSRSGVVQLL